MADQAESSANNQWVESYLEALLSYGLSSEYVKKPQARDDKFDAERQIYSKYYVSQIMQLGEEGIQDAWSKATSSRHYGEKDKRLEHLSWRVWFMKRNRNRVRKEEGKRLAAALNLPDDEADIHVDLDEDEKVHTPSLQTAPSRKPSIPEAVPRSKPKSDDAAKGVSPTSSENFLASYEPSQADQAKDPFESRVDGLYVCLISLHGLVRGERMELGKDPDTGGQVKYVVELARALAQHPAVFRVDLLTRLIKDPKVDKSYGEPTECLLKSETSDLGGAHIVRLACGPEDQYLRKENLWPHLREFADRGISHCKRTLVQLTEAQTPCELYAIHGHYADAGECAAMMASTLGTDMVMTGHSLGRNKLEHLLASGTISKTEIEKTYKISRRIEAEERGLDTACMVFTSTQQEIDEQWGLYEGFDVKLESVLRHRRRLGRYMPRMKVIPPGLDFSNLKVNLPEDPAIKEMESKQQVFNVKVSSPAANQTNEAFAANGKLKKVPSHASSMSPRVSNDLTEDSKPRQPPPRTDSSIARMSDFASDPPIWQTIFRFLKNPRKPVILAMSRPDAKKNIHTLIKAFGENSTLRELANLVLIMGNRDNIDSMAGGSSKVLQQVLKLIDSHDLYGSVAYPKRHQQSDISDIYRLPLKTRGVFTNVALQEPFGLTVIEAAAHGVPTVATKNGGPVDIMRTLHSGLLVDPTNSTAIAEACVKILTNSQTWDEMSQNGIKNIMAYSWPSHCKRALESLEAEKRFLQRTRTDKGRLSGSWDHRTQLPSPQTLQGSKAPPPISSRLMSTPYPERARIQTQQPRGSPGASHDDSEVHTPRQSGSPKGLHSRKHFVAVQLDGAYRMKAVVPLLKALVDAVKKDESVGIGLVSMLGFEDVAKTLREAGFDSEPFDWIICNSGADIWHALNRGDGKDAVWDADEQWEEHIDFRWERAPTAKMVTKLLSSADRGMLSMPSSGTMGRTLLKALGDLPEFHRGSSKLHPHHIRIELDDTAKQTIDMGRKMAGQQKEELSTVVVDRIRRRLRQNGFRCHITLQMVPTEGELHSHMHITPLRSSRALALRFLANKFGLDMTNFTVVAVPANVTVNQDLYRISAHTSDLIELISGVCKAYINVPKESEAIAPTKGAADRAVLERLAFQVTPRIFSDRIQFVKDEREIVKVVSEAVAKAEKTEKVTFST